MEGRTRNSQENPFSRLILSNLCAFKTNAVSENVFLHENEGHMISWSHDAVQVGLGRGRKVDLGEYTIREADKLIFGWTHTIPLTD